MTRTSLQFPHKNADQAGRLACARPPSASGHGQPPAAEGARLASPRIAPKHRRQAEAHARGEALVWRGARRACEAACAGMPGSRVLEPSNPSLHAAREHGDQAAVHARGEAVVRQQLAVQVPAALVAARPHLHRRALGHLHKAKPAGLHACAAPPTQLLSRCLFCDVALCSWRVSRFWQPLGWQQGSCTALRSSRRFDKLGQGFFILFRIGGGKSPHSSHETASEARRREVHGAAPAQQFSDLPSNQVPWPE